MKRVAIFDMDGTLIDSQYDITVSINHVRLVHHGLQPLDPSQVVAASKDRILTAGLTVIS